MRHGLSLPAKPGGSDETRELSDAGARHVQLAAQWVKASSRLSQRLVVHSSPTLRAYQTATIVASIVGTGVVQNSAFVNGARPETFLAGIGDVSASLQSDQSLLVVSHLPTLDNVASSLLGVHQWPLQFLPGTIAVFVMPKGAQFHAELVAFMSTEVLSN
jgi:phosphohistidine phosphatase SixA